jgi:hypothetical protein
MVKKLPQILSLSAALTALTGASALAPAPAVASVPTSDATDPAQKGQIAKAEPNVFMPVGKDLLALIVTTAADGTVLAQHYSHYSHSSHSSHSSHYSHYSGR